MNPRACLIVALLVSPAWSQEPMANAPVVTTRAFDLSNDSVRKIVRDTAATQFASVEVPQDAPIKSEPAAAFKYVPPEKPPTPKPQPQVPRLQPTPPSNGFLSAVFEILLDTAIGGDDYAASVSSDRWLRCESREPLKTTQLGYDTCPAKDNNDIRSP